MSTVTEKLCLFCKNFYFAAGSPGYSDMTPGWDSSFGCKLDFWDSEDDVHDEQSYRKCQLKARTCPKFELIEEIR